ncbi:MAG: hypothetical protein AB1899_14285 [Pseudomonadota bacterium]
MASQLPPEVERIAHHLVDMLRAEATKYLPADKLPDIRLENAILATVIDPANGQPGYEGIWRNQYGERVGKLIVNSDGSYYAEFDLCVRHPRKPGLFIEAITAWGRDGVMKAEPRVLAAM